MAFRKQRKREHFPTQFVNIVLLLFQNQIKTSQKRPKTNISHKHRNKVFANKTQQYIKR